MWLRQSHIVNYKQVKTSLFAPTACQILITDSIGTMAQSISIYMVQDECGIEPMGFYANPDVAIAKAKELVKEHFDGLTHLIHDVESATVAVYKIGFDCYIEPETVHDDCIWNSLDMENDADVE